MPPKTQPAPALVCVRLPDTSHLLRVGPYARGEIVAVSPAEAERLIALKGFERLPETSLSSDHQEPTP